MANRWTIETPPAEEEKYDWRVPNADQEHVAQTTAPGDLRIKPEDISLKPTKSPERSGVQHGADDWDIVVEPSSSWYLFGEALD